MFKFTKWAKRAISAVVIASLVLFAAAYMVSAATAPDLGTAENFAVLGGTAVTLNTSVVNGDVGLLAGSITNTGSTINGAVHGGDAVAIFAYNDFLDAYNALAGEVVPPANALTGTFAGVTLSPGVYSYDITAKTGTLTLDAGGDANAVWIFKSAIPTGYLAGTDFSVVMANGGMARNVYWWVDTYAALTTSSFQGTILAGTYITVTSGTVDGNALAETAVTLTDSTISIPGTESWLLDSKTLLPGGNSQWCLDYITTPPGGTPISTNPFVMSQDSIIWIADQPAGADVTFSGGDWIIKLATSDWSATSSAQVGDYDPDGGTFTAFTPTASTTTYSGGIIITITTGASTVNLNDYLALKINNGSGASQDIVTGCSSYLVSPPSTPDYPVPELAAGILLALGLAGLVGFTVIRHKKAVKVRA